MKNTEMRQKFAQDNITYSERRMDLLLISISGAGIYVCLETVKFADSKCMETHWLIWLAGIAFLLAVIVNFLGQFIGYKANYFDYLMCQAEIEAGNDPSDLDMHEIAEYDRKSEKYNKAVFPINVFCTGAMIIGLVAVVFWFLFIF